MAVAWVFKPDLSIFPPKTKFRVQSDNRSASATKRWSLGSAEGAAAGPRLENVEITRVADAMNSHGPLRFLDADPRWWLVPQVAAETGRRTTVKNGGRLTHRSGSMPGHPGKLIQTSEESDPPL